VNDYAKLSASVVNLGEKVTKAIAAPVSGVADAFSTNSTLLISTIGLIALSIGKRAIPAIAEMGQVWGEKVVQETASAQEAVKRYKEEVSGASKTITNLALKGNLALNEATTGDVLQPLSKDNLLKDLNKRKGIGKSLKKIVEKGLTGIDFTNAINKAGIAEKLQAALDQEAIKSESSKTFNQGANLDNFKTFIAVHSAGMKGATAAEVKLQGLQKLRIAQQKQLTAVARQTFASSMRNVFAAESLGLAWKQVGVGLRSVKEAYAAVAASQNLFAAGLTRITSLAKRATIVGAGLARVVGLIGRAFNVLLTVSFFASLAKEGAVALGILSEEFQKNKNKLSELENEIQNTILKYRTFNKDLEVIPKSVQGITKKWKKAVGVLSQFAAKLEEIVDTSKILNGATIFDNFFGAVDEEKTAAITGLQEVFAQLEKLTKKPFIISLPVETDKQRLGLLTTLQESKKSNEKSKKLLFKTGGDSVLARDEIKRSEKRIENLKNQLSEIPAVLKTIKISSTSSFLDFAKLLDNPEIALKILKKGAAEALKPVQELATSTASIQTNIITLDSLLTNLQNKSESRRILNVDTLINIRDAFKNISKEVNTIKNVDLSKGLKAQALKDIPRILDKIPKKLKDSFLKSLQNVPAEIVASGEVAKFLSAQLNKVVAGLDIKIDLFRNSSEIEAQLQEKLKIFNRRIKSGDLSAINDKTSTQIELTKVQINQLKNEVGLQKELAKIVTKDSPHTREAVNTIEAKLAAKKDELNRLENSAPGLQIQLKELDRQKSALDSVIAKQKEGVKLADQKAKVLGKTAEGVVNQAMALTVQLENSKELTANELKSIKLQQDKLRLQEKLDKAQGNVVDHARVENQIAKLNTQADAKRLASKTREADLQKQVQNARNISGGQINDGFANSFANVLNPTFWTDVGQHFHAISEAMALDIGNGVKTVADITFAGIRNVNSTVVDALISRQWDGKEEGRTLGVAIRESLKASLRDSIGSAIKKNMDAAAAKLISSLNPLSTAEKARLAEEKAAASRRSLASKGLVAGLHKTSANLFNLNISVQKLTTALAINKGNPGEAAGSISNAILSKVASGKSNLPIKAIPTGNPHLATGGVVNRPTNALIGEGANSEAVVPLPDNRSIPVTLDGSTGDNITVTQSFDFRGADSATESRLRQFANKIKQETIKEITDNINRGGSMAKTVGRR